MKKFVIYVFVVYLILCFIFTLLAGAIGHGATINGMIGMFIILAFIPLIPYATISLAINTYRQFRWWKFLVLTPLFAITTFMCIWFYAKISSPPSQPICFHNNLPIPCEKIR